MPIEPTPRERVLEVYPRARIEKKGFSYFVKARGTWPNGQRDRLLGHGRMTETSAWEEAAREIAQDGNP